MKKTGLFLLIFISCLSLFGQNATWQITQKNATDGSIELIFSAAIAKNWHMYSSKEMDGPQATVLVVPPSNNFELIGGLAEGIASKTEFDDAFEIDVYYFENKAVFIQKVKRLTDKEFTIAGQIAYQMCSGTTCIPNEHSFSVKIEKAEGSETATATIPEQTPDETDPALQPETQSTTTVAEQPAISATAEPEKEESIWLFLILAIGAGLGAILTPCVFPMIPMTVGFFISGSSSRRQTIIKALIFTISIGVIYSLIGCIVAIFKSPEIANIISSSWYMNLIFALMFIIFALSFLGAFEITLPSGLANKADRQADKGGYIASFFMAVAMAIISFSCTGPFVGFLLPMAASGTSIVKPILGLFLFGVAMGLPFLIVTIIPALLDKLKSGSWLNSVKVVFAFIMLAFVVKFITQMGVDLDTTILSRSIAIAYWIVLATLLGFYIIGKIKFSHDSDLKYVSIPRFFIAVVCFVFALFLIPGLFGASLDSVSAFLPAKSENQFSPMSIQASALNNATNAAHTKETPCGNTPKYADSKMHTPPGIKGYFDMQEAIDCAKAQNKPIFVDITGHGCANCKKMENSTFKDPRIAELINTEFVWVSLFYDEKTELPAAEQAEGIKTVGQKNRAYQLEKFASVGGPYFAIVRADGTVLEKGLGLCGADEFIAFANKGLEKFKK